jgi:hypothetical protein
MEKEERDIKIHEGKEEFNDFMLQYKELSNKLEPLLKVKQETINKMTPIEKAKYYLCQAYSVHSFFFGKYFYNI